MRACLRCLGECRGRGTSRRWYRSTSERGCPAPAERLGIRLDDADRATRNQRDDRPDRRSVDGPGQSRGRPALATARYETMGSAVSTDSFRPSHSHALSPKYRTCHCGTEASRPTADIIEPPTVLTKGL